MPVPLSPTDKVFTCSLSYLLPSVLYTRPYESIEDELLKPDRLLSSCNLSIRLTDMASLDRVLAPLTRLSTLKMTLLPRTIAKL